MSIHVASFIPEDYQPQVRITPGVSYIADGQPTVSATLVAVTWGEHLNIAMDYAQAAQLVAVLGAALADYGPDTPPLDLSARGL